MRLPRQLVVVLPLRQIASAILLVLPMAALIPADSMPFPVLMPQAQTFICPTGGAGATARPTPLACRINTDRQRDAPDPH